MTRIVETSQTYREVETPFEATVQQFQSNGWEVESRSADGVVMNHPQMPGHNRYIIPTSTEN